MKHFYFDTKASFSNIIFTIVLFSVLYMIVFNVMMPVIAQVIEPTPTTSTLSNTYIISEIFNSFPFGPIMTFLPFVIMLTIIFSVISACSTHTNDTDNTEKYRPKSTPTFRQEVVPIPTQPIQKPKTEFALENLQNKSDSGPFKKTEEPIFPFE